MQSVPGCRTATNSNVGSFRERASAITSVVELDANLGILPLEVAKPRYEPLHHERWGRAHAQNIKPRLGPEPSVREFQSVKRRRHLAQKLGTRGRHRERSS
jgi:hypothetical protein